MTRRKTTAAVDPHAALVWPCIILGIDAGAESGFALVGPARGQVRLSGQVSAHEAVRRQTVVRLAFQVAALCRLPLAIVREDWTPGGKFDSVRNATGLGARWGWWEEQVRMARLSHPDVDLRTKAAKNLEALRLYPSQWWSRAIGGKKPPRDEGLRVVRERASTIVGRPVESDEGVAVLLATVGQQHEGVAAMLPKRAWHAPGDWRPRPE